MRKKVDRIEDPQGKNKSQQTPAPLSFISSTFDTWRDKTIVRVFRVLSPINDTCLPSFSRKSRRETLYFFPLPISLSLFLFLWSEIINSGCPSYRWHGSFIICYYVGSVGWNKSPYGVTDFILHPILAWCNCRRMEAANGRDSKSMGSKTGSMLRIFFHVSRITTFCWISYKMKNF